MREQSWAVNISQEEAAVTFPAHTVTSCTERTEGGFAVPMGLRRLGEGGVPDTVVLMSTNTSFPHFTHSPEARPPFSQLLTGRRNGG